MTRKNTWPRLMAALLALMLLPMAAVQAERPPDQLFGAMLMDTNVTVQSMAWQGDTLYILTTRDLYTWQEGQAAPQVLAGVQHTWAPSGTLDEPTLHALISYEEQVLGLDAQQGVLYALTSENGEAKLHKRLTLDWTPFQMGDAQNEYVELPAFVTAAHGRLYVRVNNYDHKAVDLYSYDLVSGDMKTHGITLLKDIVPYQNGKLLAVRFDQDKRDPETMMPIAPDLVVFDPEDDTPVVLPYTLPEPGRYGYTGDLPLWYDMETDSLYCLSGGRLLRLSEQEPVAVAMLPGNDSSWGSTSGILPHTQGRVILRTGRNVLIRSTDPADMGDIIELTINNDHLDDRAKNLALLELGNVRLSSHEGPGMDNEALVTHLLTASQPFDLLVLETHQNSPQQLMKKGYLADISGNPVLKTFADSALQTFQRVIRDDAGVYAVPINIQTQSPVFNVPFFEELNQPIPTSFPELMDLVRWWGNEGHTLKEDTALFEAANAKKVLKGMALDAYQNSMIGRGEQLRFDMDTFGAMMQAIDALEVSAWDLPVGVGSGDDDDIFIAQSLINVYAGLQLDTYSTQAELAVPLSPDGVHPGYTSAFGRVLAATQQGANRETAVRFMEAYVRNLPEITRAALSQAWDTPVKNPAYEQERAEQQAYLAQYQARYDKEPEGPAKRQFAEDVIHFTRQLDNFEKDRKYLADAQRLTDYQAYMAHVYVDDALSQLQNKALSGEEYLFGMYQHGAITLEQFIQQANDKIRLMLMEAE